MTRAEAEAILAALVTLRESATDEQALSVPVLYPSWRSGVDYAVGTRVRYNGTLYRVLQAHSSQESWTPEAAPSLFARVLIPDPDTVPDWVQPDSTNAYSKGDRVRHNGKTWTSDIDGNIWEPGQYGWTEETE
jgi:chitodextrinase